MEEKLVGIQEKANDWFNDVSKREKEMVLKVLLHYKENIRTFQP